MTEYRQDAEFSPNHAYMHEIIQFWPPHLKKQSTKKHIYQKPQKRPNPIGYRDALIQYFFKGNLEREKQTKTRFTKATKTLQINSFWKEFGKEKQVQYNFQL